MDIFEKLRSGEPVSMFSEEYRPAIDELNRANLALFHINHAEPNSEQMKTAFSELFQGNVPEGLAIFAPFQIDFPMQMSFGKNVFIKYLWTPYSCQSLMSR